MRLTSQLLLCRGAAAEKRPTMTRRSLVGAIVAIGLCASPTFALLVTGSYSGSQNGHAYDLHAQAEFAVTGSQLEVILTNTSTADVTVPGDVLTAVFFSLPGGPNLKRVSAVVNSGSKVLSGTTDPGGVVGGEWAYRNGLSNKYPDDAGVNEGISSSGLSLGQNDMFGPNNLFPGRNLAGPASPDGIQYGITSAGDDPSTKNGGLAGQALIQNSVKFTLGNLPGSIHESDITNVWFQYGTGLYELHFRGLPPQQQPGDAPVPEPLTVVLGTLGLAALCRCRHAIIDLR
jgi:hypothetical protein